MISVKRNSVGGAVINLIIIIGLVVGASVLWQIKSDRDQDQLETIDETTYVSPGNEFEITLPTDWDVGEQTYEDEGIVSIELYGPRNNVVNTAFRQLEGVESESIEEALSAQRVSELVESSVGREYALLQIDVATSTFYELAPDKFAYRDELLASNDTTTGVNYGQFEDFSLNSADGWKFDITLSQLSDKITVTNYYLLGDSAEVDILLYPANSNYAQQAEEIVKSIVIAQDEI